MQYSALIIDFTTSMVLTVSITVNGSPSLWFGPMHNILQILIIHFRNSFKMFAQNNKLVHIKLQNNNFFLLIFILVGFESPLFIIVALNIYKM